MEGYHEPVLPGEVIDALDVVAGSWYLDCTVGDGGHALEILKRGGKVVGLDVDPEALERARERFQGTGYSEQNFKLIRGNFRDVKNLLQQTDLADLKFAGAIFDLGVSSLQLGSPERGFSFAKVGPLDMRMDPGLGVRAIDLIKILTRKELHELFSGLGEEKYSWQVASALVSARRVKSIETTAQLTQLIERTLGGRKTKIHPATRVFQALRMAVNDELDALQEGLEQVSELIQKNGVILVLSFHSLEDRIVKDTLRKWQIAGLGQVLTKKPVIPADDEIKANPRARSAKMRVFKKYDYN